MCVDCRMRPDNETYALPYCPRPRREEAAHSWLTRVAQEYGLNADRLLGHLLPEHNATFCLERAFYAPYVGSLSKATRIPRRTFTMMPRHLPPFASESDVRTLRKTAEPGLRAAALWWAEALLAKQEAYKMEETVHPPARQWRLLKRRAPTGLYWLLQQMSAWPRRYINQQWLDLGSILSLYR